MPNIRVIRKPYFLTSNAKKAFKHLQLAFIKALIFEHFNLKSHIKIKTYISVYNINRVLSQLNFDSNTLPNDLNSNKSDFDQ